MSTSAVRRRVTGALVGALLLGASAAHAQTPKPAPQGGGAAPGQAAPAETPPMRTEYLVLAPDRPESPKVAWDPRWPRFRTWEYVATGVFAATAFLTLAIPPAEGRWQEVNAFDEAVRSALRIESPRLRVVARDASDLVLGVMINQMTVDALLVTWWGHGRGSVAWEMAMMDIEALAFNAALNGLVAGFTSRERPYRETCVGPEEEQVADCRENKRYRSYFSGHSSTAFTIAGLVCTHHANLPLYGGGARDVAGCAASLVAAASVATLRVVSDQHFATDALTGAAIGALTGFGLPWLLHYRGGATEEQTARRAEGVSVRLLPAPFGGALMGTF